MADKLDAAAAKALDRLTDGADAVIAKLGTLADKYGPEVVNSALWVVRVDGISNVASNLVGAAIGGSVAYVAFRWVRGHIAAQKAAHRETHRGFDLTLDADPGVCIFGSVAGVAGATAVVVCTVKFLDIWNWVAIFEPKLWVAKKLLGL